MKVSTLAFLLLPALASSCSVVEVKINPDVLKTKSLNYEGEYTLDGDSGVYNGPSGFFFYRDGETHWYIDGDKNYKNGYKARITTSASSPEDISSEDKWRYTGGDGRKYEKVNAFTVSCVAPDVPTVAPTTVAPTTSTPTTSAPTKVPTTSTPTTSAPTESPIEAPTTKTPTMVAGNSDSFTKNDAEIPQSLCFIGGTYMYLQEHNDHPVYYTQDLCPVDSDGLSVQYVYYHPPNAWYIDNDMNEKNGFYAKVDSSAPDLNLVAPDAAWTVGSETGPGLLSVQTSNIPTPPPTSMPTPEFSDVDVCSPFDFFTNPLVIEVAVPYEAEYAYFGPGDKEGYFVFKGNGVGSEFFFYHKNGFWYVDADQNPSNGYEARTSSSVKSPAEIPNTAVWTYKNVRGMMLSRAGFVMKCSTRAPTTPAPTSSTDAPTDAPTKDPTTNGPTEAPTEAPTTSGPTEVPTGAPTTTAPTADPTVTLPLCENGVMDRDESDVDCGGKFCASCSDGKTCNKGRDCSSFACKKGICVPRTNAPTAAPTAVPTIPLPLCENGAIDRDESDVDCGGNFCATCADGKTCNSNKDCSSFACKEAICVPRTNAPTEAPTKAPTPQCTNGVKNADETDVDCGGSACSPCANGLNCSVSRDCASKFCLAGRCSAPTSFPTKGPTTAAPTKTPTTRKPTGSPSKRPTLGPSCWHAHELDTIRSLPWERYFLWVVPILFIIFVLVFVAYLSHRGWTRSRGCGMLAGFVLAVILVSILAALLVQPTLVVDESVA